MELTQIIRTLLAHKVSLAILTFLALLAAISISYRISTSGLETRSLEFGAAQTQILVDSPRSSLLDLSQETPPLATRAAVYAQFMRSNAVKDAIAAEVGVSPEAIIAQGPTSTLGGTQNLPRPSESRSNEIVGEKDSYRLLFETQQDLPLIMISAQAPTAEAAIKLANGTVAGVQKYVESLALESKIPELAQTQIRELGPAEGGTVNSGVSPIMMVLTFFGVMIAGCIAIVGLSAIVGAYKRIAADVREFDDVREFEMYYAAVESGDDPRAELSESSLRDDDGDGDKNGDTPGSPHRRRSWAK